MTDVTVPVFLHNALGAYAADYVRNMHDRHGMALVIGPCQASALVSAEILDAIGAVGIYRVDDPAKSAGTKSIGSDGGSGELDPNVVMA